MKYPVPLLLLLPLLACTAPAPERMPVLYCTDLFHPHDDPDDHFDLAALYALPEIHILGVVLDQGEKQRLRPGRIPVAQMNRITGRDVPCATGLDRPLRHPGDPGRDQPAACQGGVELILRSLRESREKVTLITVGSLRDLAAAWNRDPDLLRRKTARLVLFIGEASAATREWNVGLDPQAFIAVMNSGLPIWWIPCFDGGNFKNRGHASFWRADQAELLAAAPDRVLNFFLYALKKVEGKDPLAWLEPPPDSGARARILEGPRNMWCAPLFAHLAGRRPGGPPLFDFTRLHLRVDGQARVVYGESPRSHPVHRFRILDRERYPAAMTALTRELIASLDRP